MYAADIMALDNNDQSRDLAYQSITIYFLNLVFYHMRTKSKYNELTNSSYGIMA